MRTPQAAQTHTGFEHCTRGCSVLAHTPPAKALQEARRCVSRLFLAYQHANVSKHHQNTGVSRLICTQQHFQQGMETVLVLLLLSTWEMDGEHSDSPPAFDLHLPAYFWLLLITFATSEQGHR